MVSHANSQAQTILGIAGGIAEVRAHPVQFERTQGKDTLTFDNFNDPSVLDANTHEPSVFPPRKEMGLRETRSSRGSGAAGVRANTVSRAGLRRTQSGTRRRDRIQTSVRTGSAADTRGTGRAVGGSPYRPWLTW
jgi:hypothetical protein